MIKHSIANYHELGRLTKANMHIRQSEFVTEIILSVFILTITVRNPSAAELAIPSIAIIHSFNIARAVEAYKDAKQEKATLDNYED